MDSTIKIKPADVKNNKRVYIDEHNELIFSQNI